MVSRFGAFRGFSEMCKVLSRDVGTWLSGNATVNPMATPTATLIVLWSAREQHRLALETVCINR